MAKKERFLIYYVSAPVKIVNFIRNPDRYGKIKMTVQAPIST